MHHHHLPTQHLPIRIVLLLITSLGIFLTASAQTIQPPIRPDAVRLDVEEFGRFHEGYCVVRKGNRTALINQKGEIVLPFNGEYEPVRGSSLEDAGFKEGRCRVRNLTTQFYGFIDSSLKLVIPCKYRDAKDFDNGYSSIRIDKHPFKAVLDKNGQQVNLPQYSAQQDAVALVPSYKEGKIGFVNFSGNTIIPASFDEVSDFSEGLAAVMKRDEFGKSQWGYIDAKGKLVIPYKFSNKPGSFHDGFAQIMPPDPADGKFAYINRKGDVVYYVPAKILDAQTSYKSMAFGESAGDRGRYNKEMLSKNNAFVDGFACLTCNTQTKAVYSAVLVDTAFKPVVVPKLEGDYYNFLTKTFYKVIAGNNTDVIALHLPFVKNRAVFWLTGHLYGVMDVQGNLLLRPLYTKLDLGEENDPDYAEFTYWTEDKRHFYSGFIDAEGLFTIVRDNPKKL